jgi:hypothetical protein
MGFTDDCYTDGSVPSVLFSLTDCIAFLDGIIPSVKLDNVVVNIKFYYKHNNKQCVNPKSFYFNSHLHIFIEICGPFKSSFSFWVWKVNRKYISTLINISS